ncbi:MAG TPA: hypothetical protein VFQ65_30515, partial [Kofleriaceae bacterium]|nr:hypothetical protein [Kofleriaceae bacterium]
HRVNDRAGSYQALKRFVATSVEPTALLGDPDQPERLALAHKLLGELERTARLAGVSLKKRKRKVES